MKMTIRTFLASALIFAGSGITGTYAVTPDRNGDGLADVDNIIDKIEELEKVGVKFDDEDPQGHIPVKRRDGQYHMACIDLILVAYRAAGYDIVSRMGGGGKSRAPEKPAMAAKNPKAAKDPKAGKDLKAAKVTSPKKAGGGHGGGSVNARLIVNLIGFLKKSKDYHFYSAHSASPMDEDWTPDVPLKVGDMLFMHYIDASDRHSGIVTAVDPVSGRPKKIAQISAYNSNGGLEEVTLEQLFELECRRVTGFARPAAWDKGEGPVQPQGE